MSGRVYKLAVTAAAVAACVASWHIGLIAVIVYCWLTVSSQKSRAVEKRVDGVQRATSVTRTRVDTLSGNVTTTNGLTSGTINGHTDTAGLANGTISGSTGQINTGGGTAHTHGPGTLAVTDGTHQHGGSATNGTLAVADGTHHHTLPTV